MMRLTLAIVGQHALRRRRRAPRRTRSARRWPTIMALFPRFSLPCFGPIQKLPLPSNARFSRAVRAPGRRSSTGSSRSARRQRRDRGDLLSMLLLARDEEGDGGAMTRPPAPRRGDHPLPRRARDHRQRPHLDVVPAVPEPRGGGAVARRARRASSAGARRRADDLPAPALHRDGAARSRCASTRPPGAWAAARCRDLTLGGYRDPARAPCSPVSQYVMHRDPRFWPDPLRFDPERCTPEAQGRAARASPTSRSAAGARQCIGEPFAWMEGVLLLATIAQRWRLRLQPGHPWSRRRSSRCARATG